MGKGSKGRFSRGLDLGKEEDAGEYGYHVLSRLKLNRFSLYSLKDRHEHRRRSNRRNVAETPC